MTFLSVLLENGRKAFKSGEYISREQRVRCVPVRSVYHIDILTDAKRAAYPVVRKLAKDHFYHKLSLIEKYVGICWHLSVCLMLINFVMLLYLHVFLLITLSITYFNQK